jgi:tetratricopeptide (TPR) repeat protein
MNIRFRLGISAFVAVIAGAGAAPAQGAVTVVGGGMARDCYEAVEFTRISTSEAIKVCDLALEQEVLSRRNRAATYTNRGILHMREGRNERALSDYQRSLSLMPLLETKVNLGAALYGLKRYPEALNVLSEGIGTESATARATGFYNRALTYEKLGNVEAAYYDFRAALEANPEFEPARKQLSRFTVVPAPTE